MSRNAYCPFNRDSLPEPQAPDAVTVIVVEADLVVSAADVAVIVTVAGVGTTAGAV